MTDSGADPYSLTARAKARAKIAAGGPSPASRRGVTRAAGLPEAPPSLPASNTRAGDPRIANALANDAPAMPAPIMATLGLGPGSGRSPARRASSRSRLPPKPALRSTPKPASARLLRTPPATVYVAARAPDADR